MNIIIGLCWCFTGLAVGGVILFSIWWVRRRIMRIRERRRGERMTAAARETMEGIAKFMSGNKDLDQFMKRIADSRKFYTGQELMDIGPEPPEAAYRRGYRDGMLVAYNEFIGEDMSEHKMEALWEWMLSGRLFRWMADFDKNPGRVPPPDFILR